MVRLDGGRSSVTAKIIDLGLAKALDESASEAAISSPGAFAGTPEFASPAIRRSPGRHPLGSVLAWRDALGDGDGKAPFQGTPLR